MANAASIEDGMFSCYSDVVTRARAALWGSLTNLDKAKDYGLKFGRQASHLKRLGLRRDPGAKRFGSQYHVHCGTRDAEVEKDNRASCAGKRTMPRAIVLFASNAPPAACAL